MKLSNDYINPQFKYMDCGNGYLVVEIQLILPKQFQLMDLPPEITMANRVDL